MQPIAATSAGLVRGFVDEGHMVFLGVPYAAPPFGPHRFASPAPPEPWDGVRDARAYSATAPQPAQGFTIIPEPTIPGDDCLTVNVFTPDLGGARLPVLVWIHGGGFVNGCSASPWYRGTRFARDGVIVVSIGYRLGAEGFLLLDGAPPNRGVLDWLTALEWVQRNITAFGGDPANVTVAGQSAGGMACATLLAVPRARGLFRRVIAMSGAAQPLATPERARTLAAKLAEQLAVPVTADGFATLPPERLVEAQASAAPGGARGSATSAEAVARRISRGPMPLAPVVDGDLIPTQPLDAVQAGAGDGIDLLVGTTAQEFNMVVRMAGAVDEAGLERGLAVMGLPPDRLGSYRHSAPEAAPTDVLAQAATDFVFRVPAVRLAEVYPGRACAYEFRWQSPGLGGIGSCHCLDIPFVFDLLDAEQVDQVAGPQPPPQLAEAMHRAWVGFVTDGDPGWPPYDLDRRPTMLFDEESRPAGDPLRFERQVWEGVR